MEFSEILGFLKIMSRSVEVFLQNAKSIVFITIISLLPSSILFLLFIYTYQSVMTYMTNSIMNFDTAIPILRFIACSILLFSVELIFFYAYHTITDASEIATILTSLYSPNKLSLQYLYSSHKAKWESPFGNNLGGYRCRILRFFFLILAVALTAPLAILYPNPLIITIVSVVVVPILIFLLYDSLDWAVARIISMVEDGCEGLEALGKAEKLVQGQRLHGFMATLFINMLNSIIVLGFWMIVGDTGCFNLMVYGLLLVNVVSLWRIVGGVVYTVYYFQCMEYHGQKIHLLQNFQYTAMSNDIP